MSDSDSYSDDYSDDFDNEGGSPKAGKQEPEKQEPEEQEPEKQEPEKTVPQSKPETPKETKETKDDVSVSDSASRTESEDEAPREAPKQEEEEETTPVMSPVKASTPPATQPPPRTTTYSSLGSQSSGSVGVKSAPASVPPSPKAVPKPAAKPRTKPKEEESLDHATEEELEEIKELKAANEDLRQQLLSLNSQLDDALNQRGEKIVQITRMRKEPDVDKLQRDIDKMRKVNSKLQDKIMQSESVGQIHELQNVVNEKARQVEVLREENRSLENVARNQAKKLASVQYIEDRINQARDQHIEEMRHCKEKIQKLKAMKDEDDKMVKHQQQQLNLLQAKMKAAGQAKGPKSYSELEKKLGEKQSLVEDLKYQVHTLTKANEAEKKRLYQQSKGASNELKSLQQEAERLKALVMQQDNEPFPILSSSPKRRSKALKD
eukprot:TRINITY_DN5335_c0_g1_i1.p1 TRINITY_DN5335_c0_g1~~TRINITY_DN5335_c0_g1_i1.p1  ORF type:complete len:448 (+),score=194.93 TRINITY_DN5335_c0_g1_i1:42-1346(+)